ncbi:MULTISPECIES: fluoride efflux transporter CrcB [Caloramator]|uniref:Fluoride-specific ion channel FluC n=1 Tax=Caloramator australicus RC3 TaxID=857293 RepID=I7KUT0_9CLOT|nr:MULTISPECIES: fluoride efflux transporter CrcB [Caloramator]MDO6353489.1 fluoride efflux transporter CrcB [Caloramator sp. CAR-1]CCJ33703.1 Protein crcB homolog [Caloramator australicus RC3]
MLKVIYVGLGGFIGASLRYLISMGASKTFNLDIPMGTLIVNILGGLLIGFIMELSLSTDIISPDLRLFLTTGILGGLTTFSTFSYETINLLNSGAYIWGIINIVLNVLLSLIGVVVGKILCNAII